MEYNYQQIANPDGTINTGLIKRLPDYAFIPNDTENVDWVQYQEWLAEGGVPLPPDA
jgi:hypothetical protein